MLQLYYQQYACRVAEQWNELNYDQLMAIGNTYANELSPLEARVVALRAISDKSGYWWAKLPPEAIDAMLPHVEWVFTTNNLTANVVPPIKRPGRDMNQPYYGPKSELKNLTFQEFHAAEMYYRQMLDGVPLAAEGLAAVLWRPMKPFYKHKLDPDGDAREPFNHNTVPYRQRIFKNWPTARLWIVAQFFDACKAALVSRFDKVFEPAAEGTATEGGFDGMFKLMRQLADSGKYGDFEKVEQLNLYTALYELTLMRREAEAELAQAEAQMHKHGQL